MSLTPLLALALALAGPEMIPAEDLDVIGRTAPPVEDIPTLSDGTFSLSELRGKPVVLAFWASWCGPCRHEIPALDAWQAERSDVHVVAVNVDRSRRKAEAWLEDLDADISIPVAWDNEAVAMGGFGVFSMPTVFVIDAQGTVKYRKVGYGTAQGLKDIQEVVDGLIR